MREVKCERDASHWEIFLYPDGKVIANVNHWDQWENSGKPQVGEVLRLISPRDPIPVDLVVEKVEPLHPIKKLQEDIRTEIDCLGHYDHQYLEDRVQVVSRVVVKLLNSLRLLEEVVVCITGTAVTTGGGHSPSDGRFHVRWGF